MGHHYLQASIDYPPVVNYGMGLYVHQLAINLTAGGHDVTVATRNNSGQPSDGHLDGVRVLRPTADWDRRYLQTGPVVDALGHVAGQLGLCRHLAGRVADLAIEYDVVHNHSFATVPLACDLAARRGVPMVSTLHVLDSMFDEAQRHTRPRSADTHALRALETTGLDHSAAIIAPSNAVRTALIDQRRDLADRVHVLPHPLTPGVIRKTDYAAHHPFRLLFVGRMLSYKGIFELLDAAAMFSTGELELWLAGDGASIADVLRITADRTLGVKHLGQLPHDRLIGLYQTCDAIAIPSTVEAFGLVHQEAQQAGLPIISSDIAAFAERSASGTDCLTVPVTDNGRDHRVDTSALADAISDLKRDQALRERIGTNAHARTNTAPTAAHHAGTLDTLVDGLIRSSNTATPHGARRCGNALTTP